MCELLLSSLLCGLFSPYSSVALHYHAFDILSSAAVPGDLLVILLYTILPFCFGSSSGASHLVKPGV